MKRVVPLKTSDQNTVYVEVEEGGIEELQLRPEGRSGSITDRPRGSELTSAATDALEAMTSLQAGLRDIVGKIASAISPSNPSTWKLEVSIGFKGKTAPIPVILSGEADAALKLQIEWKHPASQGA
jgi:hypothetical protein